MIERIEHDTCHASCSTSIQNPQASTVSNTRCPLPVWLGFSHELVMPGRILIQVVRGVIGEDDVQPNVPVAVIYLADVVDGQGATVKRDDTRVIDEVLPAGSEQRLHRGSELSFRVK